jgi:branched-chain amino acid transport system permease protein
LNLTLLLLLMVVVGGMGSVLGVATAAVLLTIVSQAAQDSTPSWPLIYGLTIMVILALAPSGLAGAARLLRQRLPSLRREPAQ